jgi:hypothetical protein
MSCPLSSAQAAALTSSLWPGTRITTCSRVAEVSDRELEVVGGPELCNGCQVQHPQLHSSCWPGYSLAMPVRGENKGQPADCQLVIRVAGGCCTQRLPCAW